MNTYTISEWILFFMIYCLIGWIYESILVSIEVRKLTNRGFLNGPFLPIYGFGAIIMLFVTLPVKGNLFLVFLFGMLAATALEYFTGWAMEKLTHVRYWDYSYQFLNVNGYICLKCSLVWGVASVLLVRFLHKPVERMVLKIDDTVSVVVAIVFSVYFVWDLVVSTRQAMDIRKFVDEKIMQNEHVKRLQKRIDVLIAVSEDNKEKFEAKLKEKIEDAKEVIEDVKDKIEDAKESFGEDVEQHKAELEQAKKKYEEKKDMYNKRVERILKRNPKASYKQLKEKPVRIREYIKQLNEEKKS